MLILIELQDEELKLVTPEELTEMEKTAKEFDGFEGWTVRGIIDEMENDRRVGEMTFEDFIALVRDMRAWQKKYFKTRSNEAIKMSRILEGKIDKFISGLKQPKLDL